MDYRAAGWITPHQTIPSASLLLGDHKYSEYANVKANLVH